MEMLPFERAMWSDSDLERNEELNDDQINQKYERGEGRIVVENNREKLPGFVEQLSSRSYMDLRPFYQRRPRWDAERQSRLIESFLINLPVPPVFLYERNFNSYEVMDGQQRITAIKDFYENRLRLEGLQYWPELNGRYYYNLPKIVKAGIDRRSISSIVMLKESAPEDEEALLLRQIVFERLNTGGIALERQEIRNALFPSPFNEMLLRFSGHEVIRDAWGLPRRIDDEDDNIPARLASSSFYQKMEDVELVLRFFALRGADHYRRGMQGFLDIYMMRAAKLTAEEIQQLSDLFERTINLAKTIFGDLVFRPFDRQKAVWKPQPQKAFYDAVMVGLSMNIDRSEILTVRREEVIERTKRLFIDHEDGTFTGRGNTKSDVKNRIALFYQMLYEVSERGL